MPKSHHTRNGKVRVHSRRINSWGYPHTVVFVKRGEKKGGKRK